MDRYRIVSSEGCTQVFLPDGSELKNCTHVVIDAKAGMVIAKIELTVFQPDVDVTLPDSGVSHGR